MKCFSNNVCTRVHSSMEQIFSAQIVIVSPFHPHADRTRIPSDQIVEPATHSSEDMHLYRKPTGRREAPTRSSPARAPCRRRASRLERETSSEGRGINTRLSITV
jgi:hypothetical protein